MKRRFGSTLAATISPPASGTKEFVASLARYLHLRTPERDTVLYPAISYPTYAMGATLAGLRPVPVSMVERPTRPLVYRRRRRRSRPGAVGELALQPHGYLDDLEAVAAWGRHHGVLVASDECYAEFTWTSPARSILEHGSRRRARGSLDLQALESRGLASRFLRRRRRSSPTCEVVRQHAGLMVPGPVQAAVAVAYGDDAHVERTARRATWRRLELLSRALQRMGIDAPMPEGSFYLWCSKDGLDGWELAGVAG